MLKAFLVARNFFLLSSLTTCSVCIQPSTNIFLFFFLGMYSILVTVWMHSQMRQCVLKAYTQLFAFSVAFWFFDSSLSLSNNCLTRFLVGKCSSHSQAGEISANFRCTLPRESWAEEGAKNVLNCLFSTNIFGFLCLALLHCARTFIGEWMCNWEEVSFTLAQKLFCCLASTYHYAPYT